MEQEGGNWESVRTRWAAEAERMNICLYGRSSQLSPPHLPMPVFNLRHGVTHSHSTPLQQEQKYLENWNQQLFPNMFVLKPTLEPQRLFPEFEVRHTSNCLNWLQKKSNVLKQSKPSKTQRSFSFRFRDSQIFKRSITFHCFCICLFVCPIVLFNSLLAGFINQLNSQFWFGPLQCPQIPTGLLVF